MLEWLKDVFRPIRRQDPYFGTLRYLRDTHTWEGWIDFPPVGHRVEVLLSGTIEGPGDQQRSHLRELETRYSSLAPRLEALMFEQLSQSDPAGNASFRLSAIDLPEDPQAAAWELCFETDPPSWFFVVGMRGFDPEGVTVEC